jgi:hypothetical protein
MFLLNLPGLGSNPGTFYLFSINFSQFTAGMEACKCHKSMYVITVVNYLVTAVNYAHKFDSVEYRSAECHTAVCHSTGCHFTEYYFTESYSYEYESYY